VSPGPLVVVVGATATGKSDLAVDLAVRLGGEVVNADSMQLYRGMDIGTAKLTLAERRGVPHHLLDVWDVTQAASAAEYQRLAAEAIEGIYARGKVPVLAGGSGLYVRAALGDIEFPGADEAVRRRLEAELADIGAGRLHDRLRAADPVAAAAILPSNGRRIVRALEVIEISGQPFSATMPSYGNAVLPGVPDRAAAWPSDAGPASAPPASAAPPDSAASPASSAGGDNSNGRGRAAAYRGLASSTGPGWPAVQVGIRVPRPDLDRRIELRVDRMFANGLEAEVRHLADRAGLRDGRTASRALGYQQVLRHLDGDCSLDEARAETVRATRRFARRQESWFRRDPRVTWVDSGGDLLAEALALIT
jgi:tRNA dimethylallyltransferase